MQIRRIFATHLLGKAQAMRGSSLLAVLDNEEAVYFATDSAELESLLQTHPGATLLHNQNERALQAIEQLDLADGQDSLEVFQDTEGVLGLRAYRMVGKVQTPITLELADE